MEDAKRLQDLISSNALIDAFLGESNVIISSEETSSSIDKDSDHNTNIDTHAMVVENHQIIEDMKNYNNNHGNEMQESSSVLLTNSIATSHDIDALIDGLADDLEYFVENLESIAMMTPPDEPIVNINGSTANTTNTTNTTNTNNSVVNSNGPFLGTINTSTNTSTTNTICTTSSTSTLPIQLQTLFCRISRIKDLLYKEDIQMSSSNQGTNNRSNPSFIRHFLSISTAVTSTSRSTSSSTKRKMQSRNQNYNINTENAKKVLQSIRKNTQNKEIIIPSLLQYLHLLPFEIRKHVSSIFNYLLVNSDYSVRMDFVSYVQEYFNSIMDFIINGHFVNVDGGVNVTSMTVTSSPSPVIIGDGSEGNIDEKNDTDTDTDRYVVQEEQSNNEKETITANDITPKQLNSRKTPDVALHCGSMLRSIIRHPILYSQLVNDENNVQKYVFPFLDTLVNQPNFEVASDALETLHFMLHPIDMDIVLPFNTDASPSSSPNRSTKISLESNSNHNIASDPSILLKTRNAADIEAFIGKVSSTFLERDYIHIFTQRFNTNLLSSDHANYITRRLSLQLLSSILLTRSNYNIMIQYVSSKSNLRTIMMLLRDKSAHITLEAFNVFKIFVANPNKPPEVTRILADNKVKLVKYLTGLHKDREEFDEQFRDEKILVISTLEQLE